jgi:hypothetical protein
MNEIEDSHESTANSIVVGDELERHDAHRCMHSMGDVTASPFGEHCISRVCMSAKSHAPVLAQQGHGSTICSLRQNQRMTFPRLTNSKMKNRTRLP